MNENIKRLEEKIAYLERHVTEQDKVMLELTEQLAALRKEMKSLRDPGGRGGTLDSGSGDDLTEERPPHY